jgi:hypothetical protein
MSSNNNAAKLESTRIDADAPLSDDAADKIRTRVRVLAKDINTKTWDIGEILCRISNEEAHVRRWGYSSWLEWAEVEIGIDNRKAQYLRAAYRWFTVEHPLPELLLARLRRLPWTKVRLLTGRVTAVNAAEWIEIAEKKTRNELEELISKMPTNAFHDAHSEPTQDNDSKTERFQEPALSEVWKRKGFTLANTPGDDSSQFGIVEQALERASELSESDKEGHNLTLICVDFLANNDFRLTSDPKMRLRYLAKIEDLFGIDLVAIDRKQNRIIYGINTLDELAKKASE